MDLFATYAPIIGLLFFFTVFIAITIMVLRPSVKQKFEALAYIPLRENHHD